MTRWACWPRIRRGKTQTEILGADPILAEIVRLLVVAYEPVRVYLFGSKGRGHPGPDSDYDLMVLVREAKEPGYRLAQDAHSLLWDLGTTADILVWTREEFDCRIHLKASLPATILREGTLLYEA